jgi:hypothetical protein
LDQDRLWSDALPVIQDYIDSEWYFVTIKVNNQFTSSSGVTSRLSSGAVDPLRFSFDTTEIIYPMKLTALAKKDMGVLLYVFDDHKVRVSNYNNVITTVDPVDTSYFDTEYATKVSKNELKDLTKEVGKGSWFEPKKNMRLTKLYARNLPYTSMNEEVLFEDAANNRGVNDGSMTFWEWVQVPIYVVFAVPYLLFGGFFDMLGGGYYYSDVSALFGLGMFFSLVIVALVWSFVSRFFIRRTKNKTIRFLLRLSQFPAIWFSSIVLGLLFAIPLGILVAFVVQNEVIVLLDSICCFTFIVALTPLVFYRLRNRRKQVQKVRNT